MASGAQHTLTKRRTIELCTSTLAFPVLGAASQIVAKVTFPTADSPVAKATLAHCVSSRLILCFDKRTQKYELELRKASVEAGSASGRCSSGHSEGLLMLAALCRYAKRRASSGGGMVADNVKC